MYDYLHFSTCATNWVVTIWSRYDKTPATISLSGLKNSTRPTIVQWCIILSHIQTSTVSFRNIFSLVCPILESPCNVLAFDGICSNFESYQHYFPACKSPELFRFHPALLLQVYSILYKCVLYLKF